MFPSQFSQWCGPTAASPAREPSSAWGQHNVPSFYWLCWNPVAGSGCFHEAANSFVSINRTVHARQKNTFKHVLKTHKFSICVLFPLNLIIIQELPAYKMQSNSAIITLNAESWGNSGLYQQIILPPRGWLFLCGAYIAITNPLQCYTPLFD